MDSQKVIIAALLLTTVITSLNAQTVIEERTGTFRGQGNIAGGYLFGQKQFMGYVTGDGDLFIDDHISITGSVWLSLPANKTKPGLSMNHGIMGGAAYHFIKTGRWDPYVALTPGIAVVRVAYNDGEGISRTPVLPAPVISASVGFNYYIGSLFHFFAKAQGVSGQVFGIAPGHARLDELKLTAGLGFNFSVWKPKHKLS